MNLRRADIWYVDLEPTKGGEINKKRPCVKFSANFFNDRRKTVVVIPLSTSATARPPMTVAVASAGRPAVAVIDQITAKAKQRFVNKIGVLSSADMAALEKAVRQILGFARSA